MPRRSRAFVVTSGTPSFSSDASEVDKERVLALSRGTWSLLKRERVVGLCDSLLYLLPHGERGRYPSLLGAPEERFLNHYAGPILDERQKPNIEFFIAAHGACRKLGASSDTLLLYPDEIADRFDRMFQELPPEVGMRERRLEFTFYTCNSAWVSGSCSTTRESGGRVLEESFIGTFYREMTSRGYPSLRVSGFRGWFANMKSNKAAVVGDGFSKKTYACDKLRYTIESPPGGPGEEPRVSVPEMYDLPIKYAPADPKGEDAFRSQLEAVTRPRLNGWGDATTPGSAQGGGGGAAVGEPL